MSEAYDLGYSDGYKDNLPDSPFDEGSIEDFDYQKGYEQGSRDC